MDKIAQFLNYAHSCMDLAGRAPPGQGEALVCIAEIWTELARERRQALERREKQAILTPAPMMQTPDSGGSRHLR
jgi:hypothetical protein